MTSVPASGGTQHCMNTQGVAGGENYQLWSNDNTGCMTTFSAPAFSASWNNSGDYLARTGMQWNKPAPFTTLGTITGSFTEANKTGTAGGFSYIGIYGWSQSPCIEFYIVEDSFNKMPVNPGQTTNMGTVTIDGGDYILYTRPTTGTGGSNCPGTTSWTQFYSVRKTARTSGQISITDHFMAWQAAGMMLGNVQQAQLLVETGGGSGSIDFPCASVTAQ